MKRFKTGAICVPLFLCCLFSRAQNQKTPFNEPDYNKPKLFADLPAKMNLKVSETETLFKFSVGATVSIELTDHFLFKGTIVSRADEASVKTVVIRSTNRPGASFTFTRTTNADKSFTYLGRIISRNNGDAFEIAQENGQYVLQKKNLYDLISE